jgi:cytochrome c oxidase assembly protein subunit 15
MDAGARRQVAIWLLACCAMVFGIVVVGGTTRLTQSGLSIVEWEPLVGAIPPLTQADWQQLLDEYRGSPQYQQVNRGMSLDEFKEIFWWEYFHRLLGRGIGAAFLLPFLYFLARRRLDAATAAKLAGIFVLGAAQGAMGWYMVKSGLVDDPRVSQYRLTAHLGLAFLIFAAMFWLALDLLAPRARTHVPPADSRLRAARRFAAGLAALVFLMVLSGGFVAGIRAGLAYNTFPLMNGHLVPPEILQLEPWWANLFSNMATVQFNHRLIAWLLAGLVPWFWYRHRAAAPAPRARLAIDLLPLALAAQIGLGIATLLLQVPVPLGVAHQAGALCVFALVLWVNHELRAAPAGWTTPAAAPR